MRIKRIISQHRRDFIADYECEHCGHVEEHQAGYDDAYFHQTVVPSMQCKKCGQTASTDYRPQATKYPEGYQI